jgi:tetratricopeptide (TPR) repeat protein
MERTRPLAILFAAALLAPHAGLAAQASSSGSATSATKFNYYFPPKLLKKGTSKSPIAGVGSVTVKVFVNKDGTFKVQGILKSTNHGDDQAALEIAQSSTYKPATKGGKVQAAFYDYTLSFGAGGSSSIMSDTSELGQYERMVHAGNFSGAQTKLIEYLKAHPGDARAELDLGLADSFLNDYVDAAAAFDQGGTIPPNYRAVAGKSYGEASVSLASDKKTEAAIAAGRRAVDLAPGFGTYNALGFSEYVGGQFAIAAADLEKARSLAPSENVSAQQRALVDINLVAAYLGAGDLDKAMKISDEAKQLDPSISGKLDIPIGNYYSNQARTKFANKQYVDAAVLLEQGAPLAPSQAAAMYTQAAYYYLAGDKPDNVKAKADADRAIALDPNYAAAYYAGGVALANTSKTKDALSYLQKADDAAKKAGDTALTAQIENAIKRVNGLK